MDPRFQRTARAPRSSKVMGSGVDFLGTFFCLAIERAQASHTGILPLVIVMPKVLAVRRVESSDL
jgi:hypothetical protein